MDRAKISIIVFATILTFSALYAPQPIQPIIMEYFGVTKGQAALLTTVTMLPLSLSPLLYGYILEAVSAKTVLIISILVLGVCQLIFFVSSSFNLLILLRVVEGLAIPAILTGLMTYISTMTTKDNVQKVMAIYISSTIMGGFAGRFFSGALSYYFNWRVMFLLLGISLVISLLFILKLDHNKTAVNKINAKAAAVVIKQKGFLPVYMMIFSMFFMFAGMLNFIPFRLKEINPDSNALILGGVYTGYIMGIVTSLTSLKLIKILKGEQNAMFVGLTIFICSTLLFVSRDNLFLFIGMFVFCAGMFMTHTIASGYLNKISDSNKGVTNGLYVSFYYSGGTLGSILPGYIYENYGWNNFLIVLAAIMTISVVLAKRSLRSSY